jgi:hypothetical protein
MTLRHPELVEGLDSPIKSALDSDRGSGNDEKLNNCEIFGD